MSRPRIVANMWKCWDKCYCWQPQLVRYVPSQSWLGFRHEIIWQGTFRTEPDLVERAELLAELKAEALKHGIEIDEDGEGVKYLDNLLQRG